MFNLRSFCTDSCHLLLILNISVKSSTGHCTLVAFLHNLGVKMSKKFISTGWQSPSEREATPLSTQETGRRYRLDNLILAKQQLHKHRQGMSQVKSYSLLL